MAKEFWEDDATADATVPAAAGGDFWLSDKPESQQELPDGVTPSTAGAGRGSASLADYQAKADAQSVRPARAGWEDSADQLMADTAAPAADRVSVLEGVDLQPGKPWSFREASQARRAIDDMPQARPEASITETPLATQIGMDARKAVTNPAARGVMAGMAGLGQVIPGAVQAGADLVGADSVAEAAGRVARAGQQVSAPLAPAGGSEKLVFDIANSITQTAPTLIVGLGGGPAMTALFSQSAAQEYTQGRSAGLDGGTAAARAGVMAGAEVLGERFGFGEQISILKGLAKRVPVEELAPVFARQIMKEVPGEQLTTLVQFLGDKYGPGAQNPEAALSDYLAQAGDTLKVTIGQTAVMGGGPVAISAARKQFSRPVDRTPQIEALRKTGDETAASLLERRQQKEQAAYTTEREADALASFGPDLQQRYRDTRLAGAKTGDAVVQTAARWNFEQAAQMAGLSSRAQEVIGAKLAEMPAEKAAGFVQKAITGMVNAGQAQPFDGMDTLAQTIDTQRDQMLDSVLATMADIETLEAQQDETQEPAQGSAATETGPADSMPAAAVPDGADAVSGVDRPGPVEALSDTNDVIVTPELDAVHAAATSPLNDLPEPSQAQKEAGNYKVGKIRMSGLDVSIENPQGSERRGVDADGKEWTTPMRDHYGYFNGTTAADGDKLDVFIKPGTPQDYAGPVFVVDQVDPKTGKFDEHKVVFGAADQAEAEAIYRRNYSADWQGLANITELPMPAFKAWASSKATRKPLGAITEQPNVQDTPQPAGETGEFTQAARGEAPAPEDGDAAQTTGLPAAPGAGDVQADGVALLGQNSQPLSEGGKPFKTEAAARKEKRLHPDKRVVKSPDGRGFILKPMSAKQIAAQEAAARRIRGADTGDKGPLSAHGFILARGGLAKSSMADAGFDKNVRIGNRWLFTDSGNTLAQAGQDLKEAGFITDETENAASDIIRRSIASPQYTAEGWEAVAEAEAQTRFEDHLKAQQESDEDPFAALTEADFVAEDFDGTGFDVASPEIQAEVAALAAQLDAVGQDVDATRERVALQYPNATEQEFHEHLKAAITEAIEAAQPAGRGDLGEADGEQGQAREGAGESLTVRPDGTLSIKGDTKALRERLIASGIQAKSILPSATGVVVGKTQAAKAREVLTQTLTAPTKSDIEAQQERVSRADELDARAQVKRESEAGAESFTLTREDGRDGGTQPMFAVDDAGLGGDTADYGQPDTRPEAGINIELLGRDIAAFLGESQREFDAVRPYDARVLPGAEDLQRIADAFGSEVQGFGMRVGLDAAARRKYGFFGGVRTSGVVFLRDQGSNRPHLSVLGHELAHELRSKQPKLYDQLVDAITPFVNSDKYEAEFVNSAVAKNHTKADKKKEEFIGEVLADGFMEPEFWRALGRKNQSLLQHVGDFVFDMIEKAMKALGYTKRSAPYLTDYKAVMRIAGEVMAEYGVAPRGGRGDIAFQAVGMPAQKNLFQPGFWDVPQETRLDNIVYELQDGRIDLKRVQEAITKANVIPEKFDARLQETLYPGRVATRAERFLTDEAKPLLDAMARNNVTMDELADYLHARHAEERNKQIAKVNPDLPDGGAGKNSAGVLMTTEAAKQHIAALSDGKRMVLDAMAKRVDAITQGTTRLLVDEGLEKQETIDAWTGAYKSYVPLFRDEAENGNPHPTGTGMSVRGASSKRAVGSKRKATNILAHVLMQREAAITRAEKNRVAVALYGLALTNPNPDFWTTIKPSMSPEAIGQELQRMGVDPTVAAAGMQGVPTIKTVDPTLGRVVSRPNPIYKSLPGAVVLKVNGEDRVLMLNANDPRGLRMAENLKNLDGLTKLDIAGSAVGKVTRWMASVNTQYNPAFGLVNLTRDTLGGAINLSSTKLRGKTMKVLALTPGALKGIGLELAGKKSGEWGKLFRQFQADGGQTGYREMFRDANDRAKKLEAELKAMEKAGQLTATKVAGKLLGALDIFNTTLENAVRLAAYREALQEGMSRPEAARLGRELTVDFNRKGRMGRELGPLYAFFNASVQGSARTLQTLAGPAGAKIIAGGLTLGVLQAVMLLAAGYEDDEIPEFVKARALVIPLGTDDEGKKRFFTIPLPLGLHVLPNTGRVLAELTLDGGKDIGSKAFAAVGEIAGAFNPLGGGNVFTGSGFLRTVAPTVVDPIIETLSNENFAGTPIEREKYDNDPRPGFERARESTLRTPTGQTYAEISRIINAMTGGDEYEAGKFSPSPEMVRYWAQVAGGGLLREIEKMVNTSIAMSKGDDTKPTGFPVVGRFYGEVDDASVQRSRYYDNLAAIEKAEKMIRAAEKKGDLDAADRIEADNPEALLKKDKNRAVKDLRELNKEAMETVGDSEAIKAIDAERTEVMRELNAIAQEADKTRRDGSLGGQLRKALGLSDATP